MSCVLFIQNLTPPEALVLDSSSVEVVGGLDVAETLKTIQFNIVINYVFTILKQVVLVIYT